MVRRAQRNRRGREATDWVQTSQSGTMAPFTVPAGQQTQFNLYGIAQAVTPPGTASVLDEVTVKRVQGHVLTIPVIPGLPAPAFPGYAPIIALTHMGFFKAMWHTQGITPGWDRLSPGPIAGINPQPDIQSKRWIHPIIRKLMVIGSSFAVAGSLNVPIVAEGSRFMTTIDQGFNTKLSDGQSLQLSICNDPVSGTTAINVFLFLRVLISRVA